ncbi:hypothetical protein BDV29DRAFT_185842 [Aspergillus leporis]|uniref:Required for respiratory growth protein 9, mitochondrial n=1 Tax=Aspergillus leporis TaxID=41062 RepID=A0A5N5WGU7_9EURO|nr:hypothetical protein BDV29DRAFT_185842 [Aspergillus leporis]
MTPKVSSLCAERLKPIGDTTMGGISALSHRCTHPNQERIWPHSQLERSQAQHNCMAKRKKFPANFPLRNRQTIHINPRQTLSRHKQNPILPRLKLRTIRNMHEKKEHWQIQKAALKNKFKEGWNPSKKLSPDALDGIRHLHAVAPDKFTTSVLAEQFQISPEAIRRILKSKWRPSEAEMEDRRKRWDKRHDRIWSHLSELGLRPRTKRSEAFTDANVLYDKGDKDSKP